MIPDIPDDKFKSDVLQFIDVATQKFDGLISDVRTNSFNLERLGSEVSQLTQTVGKNFELQQTELRIIDGKISDVAAKVILIEKRLTVIEARLSVTETKLGTLEDEVRQIRLEMNELIERVEANRDVRERIDQLDVRVFQLEEKLPN